MSKPTLYVGARVAVKTVQFLSGRRRYPGRIGTVEKFGGSHEKTDGLWWVKLDGTKNSKTGTGRTDLFYGVDLEFIL